MSTCLHGSRSFCPFHRHSSSASYVQDTGVLKINPRNFVLLWGWKKADLTSESGLARMQQG